MDGKFVLPGSLPVPPAMAQEELSGTHPSACWVWQTQIPVLWQGCINLPVIICDDSAKQ